MPRFFLLAFLLISTRPAFAIESIFLFDHWSGTQVLIEYADDAVDI